LLDLAQNIAGARTLAVDLSLASLGYAKRQAEALGLRNIEFGQADIMRLGALGRSFDIIECCGVLHHLDDPEAGWRVLVALLRPNGLMRVALYSELARAQIVVAQNFAAQRGAGRTTEDIRQFRQDLLAHPDQALVRAITGIGDFFSISPCRDLLLHAREHRMTLPWIKCFLAGNDLQFLEFHLPPTVRRRYAERFPEDATMTDLDRWHVFEQENPRTFIGMYQFWLQKGAGGYAEPVSTSVEHALAGA
jgi:SAM-dependent methyltransferase